VTFRVAKRLAEIVRLSDQRIMELSTLAATQRVYAELLRMAEPDTAVPDLWVIRPLPPVREIASRVSTTRETAARALGQLYPTGLIRRKDGPRRPAGSHQHPADGQGAQGRRLKRRERGARLFIGPPPSMLPGPPPHPVRGRSPSASHSRATRAHDSMIRGGRVGRWASLKKRAAG
jgi:hypothetical protein